MTITDMQPTRAELAKLLSWKTLSFTKTAAVFVAAGRDYIKVTGLFDGDTLVAASCRRADGKVVLTPLTTAADRAPYITKEPS